ncbi:MAG: hypothetical protein OEL77_03095 [Nitrosopumilus sp.]|nr:hypothetical protein [Nitrosopumilus sp.]MDH3384982.1 hypothetical protein [Nitrosopumilus sp.]
MTSLLDDAKKMLELQYGDIPRLQQIKETLEQNKMLSVSDRQYLCKLAQEKSQKPSKASTYYNEKTTSDDLDIDELEEKIRVEMEPS